MKKARLYVRTVLALSAVLGACGDRPSSGPDVADQQIAADRGMGRDLGMDDSVQGDASAPMDAGADMDPPATGLLSERYPGDRWDRSDPAILFAADFEDGAGGLELGSYTGDTAELVRDRGVAHASEGALKLSFTLASIAAGGAASARATTRFPLPTERTYYVRFYMRYGEGTARPHHGNGTRVHAEGFDPGGTAGILPAGDERFNTRIDLDGQDRQFFYTYWHEMRSGRCNDGSATPGCEGDQGNTYYFGNNLKSPDQPAIDRFAWHCYEYSMRANTPNEYDGALSLWTDDVLIGTFATGMPLGEWLRDKFYTMGEWGTTPSEPFEGFNFRTSEAVNRVRVSFEIYQQQDTLERRRDDTPNKAEEQAAFYDDIVIATERIGCRVGE